MEEPAWNYESWTPWAQPARPFYLTMTLEASVQPLRDLIGSPIFTSLIVFDDATGTWLFRPKEASDLGKTERSQC